MLILLQGLWKCNLVNHEGQSLFVESLISIAFLNILNNLLDHLISILVFSGQQVLKEFFEVTLFQTRDGAQCALT